MEKDILLENIDKIHTTELGAIRISRNLGITEDPVLYCKNILKNEASLVIKEGKNYYLTYLKMSIVINSYSYTIITAHLNK